MTTKQHTAHIGHDEATAAMFRDDPQLAAEFLSAVLADGDKKELLIAMRQLAMAFGGVANVAKMAKLHPKTLYRTLSEVGNPELSTLTELLKAMGLRLSIEPLQAPRPRRRVATA
jgi:probable addiction module antidote protein